METALSLLRLYGEWGVETAVGDSPVDQRLARLGKMHFPAEEPALRRATDGRLTGPNSSTMPPTRPPAGQNVPRAAPSGEPPRAVPAAPQSGPALLAHTLEQARALAAGANTPEALRAAMDGFSACALRTTAMHTLFPTGPVQAPLMIIGDAPDADEDRSGEVFSGLCGDLLARMLTPLGLNRQTLLLATALPWRPPGGRAPTEAELKQCRPFLERAITLFTPQRLLLCGRLSARMLLDAQTPLPRRNWGESAIAGLAAPLPALVMRHPLQLRASATARKEIWQDLMLVAQTLQQAP
ncbi:DNA polymerase [Acetobacter orleanensis]|uniref:DNA polymerase n=2 Tax=Acetobacter orleanensis TaxID=104099 RepID=A0A4Y3TSP0_9PROT|nr:uracil-DNA glycosylase [Acetobacter orleanensis]GAN68483.1 bacteriophage-type DNA polymerase [Acetobacter orleanensis JCM 7639]GEB84030.1 DNA polymerase [Acetobacter orleanensis]